METFGNILQVNKLVKTYGTKDNKTLVINDISFCVSKGEFVIINGESGSGKSTLLNLLAGFDKADSGEIIVDDINIAKLNESQRANFRSENIGFIFQNFNLLRQLTALENTILPLLIKGVNRKKAIQEGKKFLDYVGLGEKLNNKPEELSGGQNQRVAIARALITYPKIICADEPTGNLDSKNREEILNLLKSINRDQHATIVMVTHSAEERKSATSLINLKDGSIV
jgi:putative ABC transport system ATP-binding protein